MVLIIDGTYGTPLKWSNYPEYFGDDKISPTHGEYIFAHKNRKRMLVFIRENLMPHYQSYRTVMTKCNDDIKKAKKILSPTLPAYVTFETLDFINKVKTTRPIPWINEFKDITSIKKEIQKKMLNELAEIFLIKNKHTEVVIDSFNKVMDSLSLEEQKNSLLKINSTKEIIGAVEKLEVFESDLERVKTELEQTKTSNTSQRNKHKKEIESLQAKIKELEIETYTSNSQFFIKDGKVKIGNPNFLDSGLGSNSNHDTDIFNSSSAILYNMYKTDKCDGCGKTNNYLVYSAYNRTCSSCKKSLCAKCWPQSNTFSALSTGKVTVGLNQNNICPDCTKGSN